MNLHVPGIKLLRLMLVLAAVAASAAVVKGEDTPAAAPVPIPEAVQKAAESTPPPGPDQVIIGAYINDIHELDFRSHSYAVDLYVWFRWHNEASNPVKSLEFMNRYSPTDHQRDSLLAKPKPMPDGTFYGIIREQGRFSAKFRLERYPFDRQTLKVVFEDQAASSVEQTYAVQETPVQINPELTLPGYQVGVPTLTITPNTYPTNFGDISLKNNETYSRVTIGIPVSRPLLTVSIKTFVPILLIIICSTLVFFVRPSYVEGRIGLAITALLTLVALHLTASSSLPDVDYLMVIDKAYLASYAFIIAALTRVVVTSAGAGEPLSDVRISAGDKRWAMVLVAGYTAILAASLAWTFFR